MTDNQLSTRSGGPGRHHSPARLPVLRGQRGPGLLQGVGVTEGLNAGWSAGRSGLQKPSPLRASRNAILVDAPDNLGTVERGIVAVLPLPGLSAFGDVLGALVAEEEAQICAPDDFGLAASPALIERGTIRRCNVLIAAAGGIVAVLIPPRESTAPIPCPPRHPQDRGLFTL
jgi:hypothetical protein